MPGGRKTTSGAKVLAERESGSLSSSAAARWATLVSRTCALYGITTPNPGIFVSDLVYQESSELGVTTILMKRLQHRVSLSSLRLFQELRLDSGWFAVMVSI